MRRLIFGLSAILVIAVIGVFLVPLLLSAEDVRNKLFSQVESATGYRLKVDGPIDISVIPALRLNAESVGVSKEIAGAWTEIATARELRFGLAWTALLGGQVRMSEISLVQPVITLPEEEKLAESAPDPADSSESGGAGETSAALRSLSLDRLNITEGTLILPAQDLNISALNLTASLASYNGELKLDGSAVYNGDPISASGSVDALGPFLEGEAVPVALTIDAPSHVGQPVAFAGVMTYTETSFALQDFTATAGDSAFAGSLAADLSGPVTRIKATLDGTTLDIDALTRTGKKSDGQRRNADAGAPTASTAPTASASASADEPIDFSVLETVEAQIDVSIDRLIAGGIAVTPLVGAIRTGGGTGELVADMIGVGSASGAASVSIDANRDNPYVSGKARINGVDLAEAGRLAGQALPVTGTAGVDVVFATAGRTQGELIGRFNASGSLSLQNGAATVAGLGDFVGDTSADTIRDIAVTAKFDDLLKPVSVAGSANWNGDRFDLSGVADVRGILADTPSAVEAKASSQRLSAGYSGTMSASGVGSGRVSLQTPSLTGLMRWLGQEPGWDSGFEAFSVDGRLTVGKNAISFEEANLRLDETRGTGSGSITLGKTPDVEARLDLTTLNVNPYLGAAAGGNGGGGNGGGGATAPAGWSDAPIDFSALNAINAKLALNVQELIYKDIKAGPVAIAATIAGGKLAAQLSDLKLYNGAGSGSLNVDASGKTPTQAVKFTLSNLDAHPFLRDAAGFGRIEGTGNIAIDVTGSGGSQRQIVSGLNGTATFEFADGAIRGINIAKMVRNLTSGTLTGWQSGEAEKTDFASLGANFAIANGQAKTDDLHLVGPLVRMNGAGSLDMPAQTLNFRVDPKVVASLEGQGGAEDLEGLGVPVIVAGPWASPRIYPDIAGILQNPQAAYEQLQKLGGGLFSLPNLNLGGGTGDGGGAGGAIGDIVKDKTGVSIDDILKGGKVDQEALQQSAAKALEQLLQQQGGGGFQIPGLSPQAPQQAQPQGAPEAQPGAQPEGQQQAAPAAEGGVPIPRPKPRMAAIGDAPTPETPGQETPAQETPKQDASRQPASEPAQDASPDQDGNRKADDKAGGGGKKKDRGNAKASGEQPARQPADTGGRDRRKKAGAVEPPPATGQQGQPAAEMTPEEQAKQMLEKLLGQ